MTVISRIWKPWRSFLGCVHLFCKPWFYFLPTTNCFYQDLEHKTTIHSLNKPLERDHRISRLFEVLSRISQPLPEKFSRNSREFETHKSNFFSLYESDCSWSCTKMLRAKCDKFSPMRRKSCLLVFFACRRRGLAAKPPQTFGFEFFRKKCVLEYEMEVAGLPAR